jgi:hypothetical protein
VRVFGWQVASSSLTEAKKKKKKRKKETENHIQKKNPVEDYSKQRHVKKKLDAFA